MGAIEAVRKGFIAVNRNLSLVLILFIYSLVGNFINVRLTGEPAVSLTTQIIWLISIGILILVDIFFQGGILGTVRDYLKEGKAGLPGFTRYGLKYYLRLLGLGVMIIIGGIVALLVAFLVMSVAVFLKWIIVGGITALVLAGIGLYWVLLLAVMSPYAIVCKELSVITAMAESVNIARRAINKVASLFLIIVLISIVWTVALMLIPSGNQALIIIVTSAFNGYFGIMIPASFMSLYLSLTAK